MIDGNYFIFNVLGLTLGTILIRGCFIALSGKMSLSAKVKDLFTYIPAAILPALIVPATFFYRGNVEWLHGKERFVVLIASLVLSYFVRNTLAIVSFGLALLYVLSLS